MGNVMVAGSNFNLLRGTILAGGTLSSEIDLGEYNTTGLITSASLILGTLTFMVSALPDAQGGGYTTLLKSDGTAAISIGPVSANKAISAITLAPLFPYRYIRLSTSSVQTNGVALLLPVRA
jgi:hypothetical protein